MGTFGDEKSTQFDLLTVNRIVRVTFTPALSSQQYDELYEIGRKCEYDHELTACIAEAAKRWRSSVNFG